MYPGVIMPEPDTNKYDLQSSAPPFLKKSRGLNQPQWTRACVFVKQQLILIATELAGRQ
jgi:hypothetical protein